MSSLVTLAEYGYRRVGPLSLGGRPLTGRELADRLGWWDTYEVQGEWVRRLGRRKGTTPAQAIEILDVFDRAADLGGDRLGFVDEFFRRSGFANHEFDRIEADTAGTLSACVNDARTCPDRGRGVYRLTQAVALAGEARLKPLLRREVAPCFFDLYPEGRIVAVRYHDAVDHAAAMMRILYAGSQAPLPAGGGQEIPGVSTLQGWHSNSLLTLGPLLLTLTNHLFYPFIGGVRGGPPGLDFVFLFDPPERHAPHLYPRSWLALASSAADFGHERVDFFAAVQNVRGPEWEHAAHQRVRLDGGYSAADRVEFLRWYVGRADRLLYEMTDPANYTDEMDPEAPIDPVFAFEHYLTVDRVLRKTVLTMSLEEPGTAKDMVFEVADLYDTLARRFNPRRQEAEFFKALFNTRLGPAEVVRRLATLPGPFAADLTAFAERCYRRMEETVAGSVWCRSKVTPAGVSVRNRDMTAERNVPLPEFVGELMRAYRNGHHGYFTAADPANRPSRYLFLVDGNLPAELSALPALWWLSYLADPGFVGWSPLPVGEYDL